MVEALPKDKRNPLEMEINLFISGGKLKDGQHVSRSIDPQCIVFEKDNGSDDWRKIGHTEQIKNTLNPEFKQAVQITYSFERRQMLQFLFVDGDDFGDYDKIGEMHIALGKLMGNRT